MQEIFVIFTCDRYCKFAFLYIHVYVHLLNSLSFTRRLCICCNQFVNFYPDSPCIVFIVAEKSLSKLTSVNGLQ